MFYFIDFFGSLLGFCLLDLNIGYSAIYDCQMVKKLQKNWT